MAAMGISNGRRASRMSRGGHVAPAQASPADQGNDPRNVKITNLLKFIRATPAGKEIKVRTTGRRRQRRQPTRHIFQTTCLPYRGDAC